MAKCGHNQAFFCPRQSLGCKVGGRILAVRRSRTLLCKWGPICTKHEQYRDLTADFEHFEGCVALVGLGVTGGGEKAWTFPYDFYMAFLQLRYGLRECNRLVPGGRFADDRVIGWVDCCLCCGDGWGGFSDVGSLSLYSGERPRESSQALSDWCCEFVWLAFAREDGRALGWSWREAMGLAGSSRFRGGRCEGCSQGRVLS